ncbi:hypothetical protein DFH09DRAFT_1195597 [Mycena vulgaris]|nr:hypothetical protein DFH09DRAFT_1195597 [Mycena vulgaris]
MVLEHGACGNVHAGRFDSRPQAEGACWSPLYVRLGVLGAPTLLVMAFFRARLRCFCSYPLRRQTILPFSSCGIPKFQPIDMARVPFYPPSKPITRLFGQDSMSGHHMLHPISATSCIHGRRSGVMHVPTSGNHPSPMGLCSFDEHLKAIDNTLGYTKQGTCISAQLNLNCSSQLPRSHRVAAPSL